MTTPNLDGYAQECRYCPAMVLWCRTSTGGWMPVNRDATADGDTRVTLNTTDDPGLHVHVLTKAELSEHDPAEPLRKSHFATCPRADEARRR